MADHQGRPVRPGEQDRSFWAVPLFHTIEIVAEKDQVTYPRLLDRYGVFPDEFLHGRQLCSLRCPAGNRDRRQSSSRTPIDYLGA
jgi:hypothetical protein